MNLQNELHHFEMELQSEMNNLKKFEALNLSEMNEMQLTAYNRGINRVKESIAELKELITEIREEIEMEE